MLHAVSSCQHELFDSIAKSSKIIQKWTLSGCQTSERVSLSTITLAEIYYGIEKSPGKKKERHLKFVTATGRGRSRCC